MLTRRDQLKLKEAKEQAKKAQAEAKKKGEGNDNEKALTKEQAKAKKEEEKAKKKAEKEAEKKRKAQEKAEAKAKAKANKTKAKVEDGEATGGKPEEREEEEPEKPRRRLRRALGEEEAEDEPDPKVSKTRATAKAKAKAEPKPKGAPKGKAKAKAVASPKRAHKGDDDDDEIDTPRRELFKSDDEKEDEGDATPHMRYNSKTGKVEPLKEILEKCKPQAHMAAKRQQVKPAVAAPASGEPGDEEDGKKTKGQRKGKGKMNLSPFAKKEVKRRKKLEEGIMKEAAREDPQIQGILMQHMKNVERMTAEEDVKEYLISNLKDFDLNKEFRLNEYWKRPAVGVKVISLGDGSVSKAPEVAYFGKVGTCCGGWNVQVALVYAAASMMVSGLSWGIGWGGIYVCNCNLPLCYTRCLKTRLPFCPVKLAKRLPNMLVLDIANITGMSLPSWTLHPKFFPYMRFHVSSSQASWLADLPNGDLQDFGSPTGKVQTHLFYMRYNANVAGSKFKPKSLKK